MAIIRSRLSSIATSACQVLSIKLLGPTSPSLLELLLVRKYHGSSISGFNHVCQPRFLFDVLLVFTKSTKLLTKLQVKRLPQQLECHLEGCLYDTLN